MKIIRRIDINDLDSLIHIARTAGAGFTSLPPIPEALRAKIELSEHSFATDVVEPGHQRYMFVMEETETGRVGGCCAVEAACGLDEPFYNYHVGITVHASRELDVYRRTPTLYLSNDYTGASVMVSLYLAPDFRGGGAGRLLSKCRFAFMGQFPHRFAPKVIAEMRGISDEIGRSPFWEGLGRHFFSIDYDRAEHIVGMGNKAFIAELMPKHPIYTTLLPVEAQNVMGRVHPHTAPALHLLEQEGFRYQGYIDIFDGGPTVEAPLTEIRSIRHGRVLQAVIGDVPAEGVPSRTYLAANTELLGFRCTLAELALAGDTVTVPQALAEALRLRSGDMLRLIPV
jgi:arginine N-succinyltransferase